MNLYLETGRAITMASKGCGQLSVARGQLWATLGLNRTPRTLWKWTRSEPLEPRATPNDYFLNSGDTLLVPAGANVVLQGMGRLHDSPVAFGWSGAPLTRAESVCRIKQTNRIELAQAGSELGTALGQLLRAVRRLLATVLVASRRDQPLKSCVEL